MPIKAYGLLFHALFLCKNGVRAHDNKREDGKNSKHTSNLGSKQDVIYLLNQGF